MNRVESIGDSEGSLEKIKKALEDRVKEIGRELGDMIRQINALDIHSWREGDKDKIVSELNGLSEKLSNIDINKNPQKAKADIMDLEKSLRAKAQETNEKYGVNLLASAQGVEKTQNTSSISPDTMKTQRGYTA